MVPHVVELLTDRGVSLFFLGIDTTKFPLLQCMGHNHVNSGSGTALTQSVSKK